MDRFKVIEGSQSCHSWFDWTVVNTDKPNRAGDEFEAVCECFEEENARMIATALNAQRPSGASERSA